MLPQLRFPLIECQLTLRPKSLAQLNTIFKCLAMLMPGKNKSDVYNSLFHGLENEEKRVPWKQISLMLHASILHLAGDYYEPVYIAVTMRQQGFHASCK